MPEEPECAAGDLSRKVSDAGRAEKDDSGREGGDGAGDASGSFENIDYRRKPYRSLSRRRFRFGRAAKSHKFLTLS
jgi:hypothetical protein